MPVAISGDGTLTGIAVGGLPDGIVDADMLASNSVQPVKIVDNAVTKPKATGFGKILGYAHVATSSATDVSALSSFTEIGSFALSYTPTVATSKLLATPPSSSSFPAAATSKLLPTPPSP